MTPGSPLPIVLGIIVGVSIVGMLIALWRNRATYRQYEDIKPDVREIANALKGDIFRDGADLVVSGFYEKMPTIVRFSHDENTPGVNIRMTAPTSFTLSVVPKGSRSTEGRVVVRTGDDMFDARFVTRTDHATQARLFLGGGKIVSGILQRLCCSSQTYFTIGGNAMELSELAIPSSPGRHLLEHLRTMGKLQFPLRNMPNADAIKVSVYHKERKLVARAAIAVGVIAAVVGVVSATRPQPAATADSSAGRLAEGLAGMPLAHSGKISNLQAWHLVTTDELSLAAQGWMRNRGVEPNATYAADLNASGAGTDAVYLMANAQGERRVVVFSGDDVVYDASFPNLELVAPVRRSQVSNITWQAAPEIMSGGDGLLLVRDLQKRRSGIVLFVANDRVVTGIPEDLQQMNLR